jgi:colicin import membrane protein
MTPEEQAAADAKAATDKAAADAEAAKSQDVEYWKSETKKTAEKLKALKEEVKAGADALAKLKAIEDAAKSAEQKLAEENAGLKTKAARAEALEAQVQAIFDEATADLNDAQKAVIVGDTPEAKLAHFRALKAAGVLGDPKKSASPGAKLPGEGTTETITKARWDTLTPAAKMKLTLKGVRVA